MILLATDYNLQVSCHADWESAVSLIRNRQGIQATVFQAKRMG